MTGDAGVSEPPTAEGLASPVLLAALVMLFVHLAAGAMLAAVAVSVSPGPRTAGGIADVLVWVAAALLAAGATRPVLRRTRRPLAVGTLTGLLVAGTYTLIAVWPTASGAVTDHLAARAVSLGLAGVLVGVWTARRPAGPGGSDGLD